MKKGIVMLSAWTVLCIGVAIFQSCDTCGDDGPFNYRLASIAGEVKKIDGVRLVGTPQPEYNIKPYLSSRKANHYDSIGIEIIHTVEPAAFTTKGYLFNSAFACDPVISYERLGDINIASSEDYTTAYPAGTDLKEIMSVREGYQVQGITIPTYLSKSQLGDRNLFFTFNIPPSTTKTHNLSIKYRLSDGREYEAFIEGLTISS
jgi:hypothetical protein